MHHQCLAFPRDRYTRTLRFRFSSSCNLVLVARNWSPDRGQGPRRCSPYFNDIGKLDRDLLPNEWGFCFRNGGGRPLRWGYNGIFPCFFLGLVSRLFSSERRAVMSFARVWEGSMTASM